MNHRPQASHSQDRLVNSQDGRLFTRTWSPAVPRSTVPMVLLHDSLGSVELWRGFPAGLCASTGRQVIAYDRLGFGQSDPYPGKLPLDFVAREAVSGFAAIRQQLGIDRFALFGHSVGGGMAVHVAATFAKACIALITESAQAFVEQKTLQGIAEARATFKDPGQFARLRKYHDAKAGWVLDAWINTWLNPDFAAWSLASVLPQVTCPTLAIHGNEDEYGSSRHPELIAQLSGGSTRLEVLPATRHVPHRETEAAILKLVADFLAPLD